MPIFRVKSVKIYTGQKKFTRASLVGSWQISGMIMIHKDIQWYTMIGKLILGLFASKVCFHVNLRFVEKFVANPTKSTPLQIRMRQKERQMTINFIFCQNDIFTFSPQTSMKSWKLWTSNSNLFPCNAPIIFAHQHLQLNICI